MRTLLASAALIALTVGAFAQDKRPDYGTAVNAAGAKKIAAGVFGAPSYVLPSGEIFWGQDRLDLLERALKMLK